MDVSLENHGQARGVATPALTAQTAFGCPRVFLENRFVYLLWCARARGLTVGVNLAPDRRCNFNCVYCEVPHHKLARDCCLDVEQMSQELFQTLELLRSGGWQTVPALRTLPRELMQPRRITISGDGEPTLCPRFVEAMQSIVHVKAKGCFPSSRLALITNGTGLDAPHVQRGLRYFTHEDEVWVKLDAGTQAYMDRVNRPRGSLDKVLANLLMLGRQRPVVVQSLFCLIDGEEPPPAEIAEYAKRLLELKLEGAQISLVQIYSATRPTLRSECGHLRLKVLSQIAHTVRRETGLAVEVF